MSKLALYNPVIKDYKERYKIIAYIGHGRATASEGGPTPLW